MTRAVKRIEQDLAAIGEAIDQLATQFQTVYTNYLTLLGKAVGQQLIMASYRICTQGYPEAFLKLSYSERQQLQQSIRQLGKEAQEDLLSYLEDSAIDTEDEEALFPLSLPSDSEADNCLEQDEVPSPVEMLTPLDVPLDSPNTEDIPVTPLTQLDQLIEWQENIEEAINQTLQAISLEANRLLRTNEIFPEKLPVAVLEAASKVESSGESTSWAPNLLNLMMETKSDEESDDSTLMQIIAINLRRSEIEFVDPALSAGRNQIRLLMDKLNKIQQQYQKTQREWATAQAEAAWRSSWFEE